MKTLAILAILFSAFTAFAESEPSQSPPGRWQRLHEATATTIKDLFAQSEADGDLYTDANGNPVTLEQIQSGHVQAFYYFPSQNKQIKILYRYYDNPASAQVTVKDSLGRSLASRTFFFDGTMTPERIAMDLLSFNAEVSAVLEKPQVQDAKTIKKGPMLTALLVSAPASLKCLQHFPNPRSAIFCSIAFGADAFIYTLVRYR